MSCTIVWSDPAAAKVERGSMIVLRMPDGGPLDWVDREIRDMVDQIHRRIGHDQFVVMVLYGEESVAVVGPEGMRDVLASLSRAQLEQLAAMDQA